MSIGSEGRNLPSAGREALNLEVCDRLFDLVTTEGSWLDEGATIEVAVRGERGGMV
jgi:hypothetical protein